ncbi:MAG TPA: NUDIX hydrolase [Ferrovibrio sp.]|jgi:8-oxo-dGTP pyrophosphatase MutT (NUDIX family)|uniref:NUDIX hydrolase n=1 Tax=Ferrovibrio sp. TaxID=1917215 RepID=UPI002B4B1C69|nr:NUDIX hydrolase [Ferrovibrio sp.]HLT78916.1 NUDIX hydrolase [Ferrovibrio sp.]
MADDQPKSPPQPVRDAATLILWRRSGSRLEVLMGERHGASAFMPNRYVFPGGRLDAADYRIRPAAPLNPVSAHRLARSRGTGPRKAVALALAAIRETFEETGLRLAEAGPPLACPSPSWQAFFGSGFAPAPSTLLYLCRAITPPGRPRRFDARFFAAPAEAAQGVLRPSAELDKLSWMTPEETRDLLLPNITQYVLANLEAWLEPAAAADPARQVPFHHSRHGKRQLDWE